jgi:hypothetical protein
MPSAPTLLSHSEAAAERRPPRRHSGTSSWRSSSGHRSPRRVGRPTLITPSCSSRPPPRLRTPVLSIARSRSSTWLSPRSATGAQPSAARHCSCAARRFSANSGATQRAWRYSTRPSGCCRRIRRAERAHPARLVCARVRARRSTRARPRTRRARAGSSAGGRCARRASRGTDRARGRNGTVR